MEPFNRHVLIKPQEKKAKEEKTLVVLPSDYKQPESPHLIAEVLALSSDCNIKLNNGDMVILEKRMLQKIEIDGKMHYLVLENYIYGRI